MRKCLAIVIFLLLQLAVCAQNNYVSDSLKADISHRKLNGFLSMITDFTINKNQQFVSAGMGGAFLIGNKFFIGGYGLGLISSIQRSDILINNILNNYQLNYAHGGLWLGIVDFPCEQVHSTFSLKVGWGALFMSDISNTIDYSINREEFFVITPQLETEIKITNWLRANLGIGVRFLSGISMLYKDLNGNIRNIYNSSDFEGFIFSFALSFGSFCKRN